MKRIYWIIGIVVIVVAAGAFGIKKWLLPAKAATAATQTVKVTVGSVSTSVAGSGSVRSGQGSNISWQTSGVVASVPVQIGQQVKTGDVLASLDPTTISSSIIQAQTDLINAQTTLDNLLHPTALALAQAQAAVTTAQTNLDNLLNPTALAIAQANTAVQNAQTALDTLQHPTALAIAQAQSALTDAQTAMNTLLHPDPQAIAQAQTSVNADQVAVANAQSAVDRLKYARGSQAQIDAAQAAYVLAQSEVDRLQKVYEGTPGDPTKDPVKAQALSALQTAITKRDQALANLN
jgi:multidrug resistance efflux pump